jgi:hypothetical protein
MKISKVYKSFLAGLGWFFVALGVIGIFVPLMPTTIFFILAAACFAKSSERFYNWLINHPRFGKFIKDYREKRGMPLKSKITSISLMLIAIGSSAYFFTEKTWVRILLLGIAFGASLYIISLKTITTETESVKEAD